MIKREIAFDKLTKKLVSVQLHLNKIIIKSTGIETTIKLGYDYTAEEISEVEFNLSRNFLQLSSTDCEILLDINKGRVISHFSIYKPSVMIKDHKINTVFDTDYKLRIFDLNNIKDIWCGNNDIIFLSDNKNSMSFTHMGYVYKTLNYPVTSYGSIIKEYVKITGNLNNVSNYSINKSFNHNSFILLDYDLPVYGQRYILISKRNNVFFRIKHKNIERVNHDYVIPYDCRKSIVCVESLLKTMKKFINEEGK